MLSDQKIKQLIEPSLDKLLFVMAIIAFVLMSPYFIWSNQLMIYRLSYFTGIIVLLYIFIKYHNFNVYNVSMVISFFVLSIYLMIGGTEYSKITYIPFLAMLYIILKPIEQARIFDILVTILAFFYVIGLFSYFLSLTGINKSLGYAMAPNLSKAPYLIFFGHIEETGLPVYRFCSVFDEAGVVGTTNGLILASLGISKKNIKSIIILFTGLVSFSLAFYVMLSIIIFFQFNLKNILIAGIFGLGVILFAGDKFNNLIAERLVVKDGEVSGDNRTAEEFDEYFNSFINKGGKDLIFGFGTGFYSDNQDEDWHNSSIKAKIFDWGIVGTLLILVFYIISTTILNNSLKGWLVCLIFMLSAYQRPDLVSYSIIVLFLGGLNFMKFYSVNNPFPCIINLRNKYRIEFLNP